MIDDTEHTALLRAIHDQQGQQGQQLRMQAKALEPLRGHFALAHAPMERIGQLRDRADAIQSRATSTEIAMWLALPASALILMLLRWSVLGMAWS